MALNKFTTEEMAALTATWVQPGHRDRKILTSRPVTAVLVPELDAAHDGVLKIRPPEAQRLGEIQGEQRVVDGTHDRLLRASWHRLLAEGLLVVDDPELVDQIRDLRDLLLPEGLATTQKSYREEVGHGARVSAQLSEQQQALLQRMSTLHGSMLQVVTEWLEAARKLGVLDRERNSLLPLAKSNTRSENSRRRSRWIRIVNLIRTNAALLKDDRKLHELLGRIDKAEQQLEQRLARARAQNDGDDGDDGDDGSTPASEVPDDDSRGDIQPDAGVDASAPDASATPATGEDDVAAAPVSADDDTDDGNVAAPPA